MSVTHQELKAEASFKIIAANIRDSLDLKTHDDELVTDLFAALNSEIGRQATSLDFSIRDFLVKMEELCFGELPLRLGSTYLLQGREASFNSRTKWLTTVVSVDLWQKLVGHEVLRKMAKQTKQPFPFIPMGGSNDLNLKDILWKSPTGEFIPKADFELGFPVVWVCPGYEIERLAQSEKNSADTIRDRLGLIHHQAGKHLVALHLPIDAVKRVKVARPTFADAGKHRRFLAKCDEDPPPFTEDKGQTLDLENFEDNGSLKSGTPELVCARLTKAHLENRKVRFHYLGSVVSTRGSDKDTDDIFAEKLVSRDASGYARIVGLISEKFGNE